MRTRRNVPPKSILSGIIHFTVKSKVVSPDKEARMRDGTSADSSGSCVVTVTKFSKGLSGHQLPTRFTLNLPLVTAGFVSEWGPSGNPRIDPCLKNEQLRLVEGVTYVAFVRCPQLGDRHAHVAPTLVAVMPEADYNEQERKLPPRVMAPPRESGLTELPLTEDDKKEIARRGQARAKNDERFQIKPEARDRLLGKKNHTADKQTAPPGTSEEAA